MRWILWVSAWGLLAVGCSEKMRSSRRKKNTLEDSAFLAMLKSLDEEEKDTLLRPTRAPLYKGSYPIRWKLIHTDLSLSLDWAKREIPGEAILTLKPHFAPMQELVLDAKAFQIEDVRLLRPSNGRILHQRYDTLKLYLTLDRFYTAAETVQVYIRYRAQPERLEGGGSAAIGGRKGGYFINPDGKRTCVPRQFWTQGEPESASAWFPTLDSPNQKSTQRLCITLEDTMVSLSNGLLVSQKKLPGGMRQDCWEMRQPHAPYLFALVVGPFRIIKDSWRGREVSYYMEPGKEKYASHIFGNTPKMLEFFSTRLGVEYPWPKYSQVIVRDFISGAMENTTATIHGDMLFYDAGKALTNDHEEVIAHELFHHWFGDLVTCESWSQLPLNESFADYSEYLWLEYSRGEEAAENHRRQSMSTYLMEASQKKVSLVRFDYNDPMDMFDAHSYQKGGLVLHLLRNLMGDSAFFAALQYYLQTNAYKAADIDHLRHAVEEITGEDWTWFFDQHFRRKDEVRLTIQGRQSGDTIILKVRQEKYDSLRGPYRYVLPVAILSAKGYEELPVELLGDTQLVWVRPAVKYAELDPKRLFVGASQREYPLSWWKSMLTEGKYFWQRCAALQELQPYLSGESDKIAAVLEAYSRGGAYWKAEVWQALEFIADSEAIVPVYALLRQALQDSAPIVRAAAWRFLQNAVNQGLISVQGWKNFIPKGLSDPATEVRTSALRVLIEEDSTAARETARQWLTAESEEIFLNSSALLILRNKDKKAVENLLSRYPCIIGMESRMEAASLIVLAYEQVPDMRASILPVIRNIVRHENPWYLRLQVVYMLKLRMSKDKEISQLLRQVKEEEKHPTLSSIYKDLL
ncbi:MAG: M1 family metallopeptidase [Bacteroidia bacterium]|nr:M1 family metallopeptidase [Bacteroidia bacterium]